jgi:3-oxoadipate CoA-transferase beta subunit
MDLAVGAKRVWVVVDHTTKDGRPRLVERCSYPLTARGAVARVYTNLAVIDVTRDGFLVREIMPRLDFDALQAYPAAPLLAGSTRCLTRNASAS